MREARTMKRQYRQGDVLLCCVDRIPSGAKSVPRDGDRVVVAEGELTGHAHAFTAMSVRMCSGKKAVADPSSSLAKEAPGCAIRSITPSRCPRGTTSYGGSGNIRLRPRASSGIDSDADPSPHPRRALPHSEFV